MAVEVIKLHKSHKNLHIWINQTDGSCWACMEYDHGPFCRLCNQIDHKVYDILKALIAEIRDPKENRAKTNSYVRTTKAV